MALAHPDFWPYLKYTNEFLSRMDTIVVIECACIRLLFWAHKSSSWNSTFPFLFPIPSNLFPTTALNLFLLIVDILLTHLFRIPNMNSILPAEAHSENQGICLFNKWSYEEVEVKDISLADYSDPYSCVPAPHCWSLRCTPLPQGSGN